MDFEWDEKKRSINLRVYGLDLIDAARFSMVAQYTRTHHQGMAKNAL